MYIYCYNIKSVLFEYILEKVIICADPRKPQEEEEKIIIISKINWNSYDNRRTHFVTRPMTEQFELYFL